MSEDDSEHVEPPAYLSDNIAEFLEAASPRIAAITWRRWMEPYFRLEEHELGVRLSSQRSLQGAIVLWMKQIDLLIRGLTGTYELAKLSREERHALSFRLNLLGLSISTSKLSLDGLLGGHYNGSLSLSRSQLETWRRMAYARLQTSDIWRWFPQDVWPPDVLPKPAGQMPTKIPDAREIGTLIDREGADVDKQVLERVRSGFGRLSDYAHPTLEGASQTWTDDRNSSVFSPKFSELHAKWCLIWGLFANQILLMEAAHLRFQGDDWANEQEAIDEEFSTIMRNLKTEEGYEQPSPYESDPELLESDEVG